MAMILNESIGKRIAQLRKEHHMTQSQLAEKLDISVKHCSCVERGAASLSMDRLLAVCDLFGISLDYLVRGRVSANPDDLPPVLREMLQTGSAEEKKLLMEYLEVYRKVKQTYAE